MQKNLYGWDVVYGASKEVLNAQLINRSQDVITNFNYVRNLSDDEGRISLSGQFGAWAIVGGSNSLIHIKIPVEKGTMAITGIIASCLKGTDLMEGQEIDVSGISITIETAPAFKVSKEDPNTNVLTFDFQTEGDTIDKTSISICAFSDADKRLQTDTITGIFKDSIIELLSANKDKMTFVFARIFNQKNAEHWFDLQFTQFYYAQAEGNKCDFLNILGMVYRDNANGNQANVDPAFGQDAGVQSYLGISQDLFLEKLIMPLLPAVFGNGASADSFQYDFSNHAITNNGTIDLNSVSEGPFNYYPKISNLSISVQGDCLRTAFQGTCDMHIETVDDMTFSYIANNKVVYDDSQAKFIIQPDPNPQKDHNLNLHWYNYLEAGPVLVLGVVGLIFGAIAAAVTSAIEDSIGSDSTSAFSLTNIGNIPMVWAGLESDAHSASASLDQNLTIIDQIKN